MGKEGMPKSEGDFTGAEGLVLPREVGKLDLNIGHEDQAEDAPEDSGDMSGAEDLTPPKEVGKPDLSDEGSSEVEE